jgi:hypothetical protein
MSNGRFIRTTHRNGQFRPFSPDAIEFWHHEDGYLVGEALPFGCTLTFDEVVAACQKYALENTMADVSWAENEFYIAWILLHLDAYGMVEMVRVEPDERTPEPENDDEVVATQADEEELSEGRLHDAQLGPLGLDEITRQYYIIPVMAAEEVIDLMDKAVNSTWPNDYKSLWHKILLQSKHSREISILERQFTVIIRGVGQKQYWPMVLRLKHDPMGEPYFLVMLADAPKTNRLFDLGHVMMTDGAAALGVDFRPYIARHQAGDWGELLDDFDKRQNRQALKEGLRILSAYNIPVAGGETERIWIITEADRSVTTVLLAEEY